MCALALLGLLLLGAVLYSRAVRIQRFLEPALALTQPKIEFAQSIGRLLAKEFGEQEVQGIKFTMESILVDEAHLTGGAYHGEVPGPVMEGLANVFLSILNNPESRAYVDSIIVAKRVPLGPDHEENRRQRLALQDRAELLLDSLFEAEPELEENYSIYFTASAIQMYIDERDTRWVEFRIIPSGQVHIDMLQRLQKYVQ